MGTDAGGEGDVDSQAYETLGELKSWVDMALSWKCNKEEVALDHDWLCFVINNFVSKKMEKGLALLCSFEVKLT